MSKKKHKQRKESSFTAPMTGTPELTFPKQELSVPDEAACHQLWDKYEMLENIRSHSALVASTATKLASRARELGVTINVEEVYACGLLHDLAKTYCLRYGGGHAQLGASWVLQETDNYAIAQGVFHHVHWPWTLPCEDMHKICTLPFLVIYADKRAKHDTFVTLEERFTDLLDRYGITDKHKANIECSYQQGVMIEEALSRFLSLPLKEIRNPEDLLL